MFINDLTECPLFHVKIIIGVALSVKSLCKSYLIILFSIVSTLSIGCLLLNMYMDPLWYFKGNMHHPINYAFNERISKVNQYMKKKDLFDCFVFGSSRTTLLDAQLIKDMQCFNFSFSAGNIREINAYSSYVLEKGPYPKLVIIGIDDFNFFSVAEDNIPEFIKNKTTPPSFVKSYLSFDALKFSFRLLRKKSPLLRYYDNNFKCRIMSNAPKYFPEIKQGNVSSGAFRDVVEQYRFFNKLFNKASIIGYVPPISAWKIASKNKEDLEHYLETIFSISRFITPLYDFSIPSEMTMSESNTYDGSHYDAYTNKKIVKRMSHESRSFGIRVDKMTKEQYFYEFHRAINDFLMSSDVNLPKK